MLCSWSQLRIAYIFTLNTLSLRDHSFTIVLHIAQLLALWLAYHKAVNIQAVDTVVGYNDSHGMA